MGEDSQELRSVFSSQQPHSIRVVPHHGTNNIRWIYSAFKHNTQLAGFYRMWLPACSPPCEWSCLFSAVLADVQGHDIVPYLNSRPEQLLWFISIPVGSCRSQHLRWGDGVTLPSFSPSISTPSLCLNRASPFSLEVPVSDSDSWGKHSEAMFSPGPADGGLLREVTVCLRFGVRQRDDVVILGPVLVHGCVEDAAAGGAGSKAGVVQHRDRGSGAHNSGVVTPHELLIHLLVPLLSQGRLPKKGKGLVSGENALVLCFLFLPARAFLEGLASSSGVQLP